MGVWIETSWFGQYRSTSPSHPVWVCGLKLTVNDGLSALLESHPVWVCGLKHEGSAIDGERLLSYPVWVCGLKHPR